ncbi:MAG: S1/P1 Nuclease, partial [Bacteroidota bacterium]
DTVLKYEKELTKKFPGDQKFSFEDRNGIIIRQYSTAFSKAYDELLKGMVERRMRQSIYAVASFWYTAWVNAGQPDLKNLTNKEFSAEDLKEFESLNNSWKNSSIKGREHEIPNP